MKAESVGNTKLAVVGILIILAAIVNSFCDALKFSGLVNDVLWVDFIWHFLKYLVQIPLWMVSGYFFIDYCFVNNKLWDIWHPKKEHAWIALIVIMSVGMWQLIYRVTIYFINLWLIKP